MLVKKLLSPMSYADHVCKFGDLDVRNDHRDRRNYNVVVAYSQVSAGQICEVPTVHVTCYY